MIRRLQTLFAVLALAAPLAAQDAPALEERIRILEEKLEKKPDLPSITPFGQLQAVGYWFGQTAANREQYGDILDGAGFRRVRFGFNGGYRDIDYCLAMEFVAINPPRFLDVWATLRDVPYVNNLRMGHFFEPFGLERITSNRFVPFLERAMISQAFAPGRNLGVMAFDTFAEERGTWAIGLFRSNSDTQGWDLGDRNQSAITARLTGLPIWNDDGQNYLHLGAAYSIRANQADQVSFFAQPEANLGSARPEIPAFVDTGPIDSPRTQLAGFEFAANRGRWSVHAEYNLAAVESQGTQVLHGGYLQLGCFLTGEHLPYLRETATFGRVQPNHDLLDGGPGAWQFVLRLSHLNLDSGPVRGGKIWDLSAGTDWALNPFCQLSFNYIFSNPTPPAGVGGQAHIFGIRLDYDF